MKNTFTKGSQEVEYMQSVYECCKCCDILVTIKCTNHDMNNLDEVFNHRARRSQTHIMIAGGIVVLFLPETFGVVMPETIADCSETSTGVHTFVRNITMRNLRDARESIRKRHFDIKSIAPTDRDSIRCLQEKEEDYLEEMKVIEEADENDD